MELDDLHLTFAFAFVLDADLASRVYNVTRGDQAIFLELRLELVSYLLQRPTTNLKDSIS